jgi:hypothetical protein
MNKKIPGAMNASGVNLLFGHRPIRQIINFLPQGGKNISALLWQS